MRPRNVHNGPGRFVPNESKSGYCGGPTYITKARNAVKNSAKRIGLALPTD